MAKFNEVFLGLADTFIEIPEVHPVQIAHALSMLVIKLASAHHDLIFLSAILASSCTDIEQGKYDFVKKTHGLRSEAAETKGSMPERLMPRTMFEVHGEANGKKGSLTFEVEGNAEEVEEVFQAADYAVTQKAAINY
jgi:hypothetical protein